MIFFDDDIPDYGTLFTTEEFTECVKSGGFIDYDGYGHYSNGIKINNDINVIPSRLKKNKYKYPSGVTHILWFNR